MAPLAARRRLPKPLPQVPGPKLAPFTRTGKAVIQFLEELGDGSRSADSRVWKVRIRGKGPYYALKVFKFNSVQYLMEDFAGELSRKLASPQLYTDYFDPFSCECRAYGRLKQEHREDLAVRAHGYLLLNSWQEAEVTKRALRSDPGDDNPWCRDEENDDLPLRAIVKELVDGQQGPFTPSQVPTMWEDLESLHKLGIVVHDINVHNYIGGKLIDFSRAWTTPHPWCRALAPVLVKELRLSDPERLHNTILRWGDANDWKWSEVDFPEELKLCAWGSSQNDRYGTDPRYYDWRKWEKDLAAAEEFQKKELLPAPERTQKHRGWG